MKYSVFEFLLYNSCAGVNTCFTVENHIGVVIN